jgi:hypothetical protein
MKRQQQCTEVRFNPKFFDLNWADPHQKVWFCKVADNTAPRITCQDRELVLRPVREWLMGVDPIIHGGPWLSKDLILSFLVGLESEPIAEGCFVCKRILTGECPGRKANEAHLCERDVKKAVKKEGIEYIHEEAFND